MLAQYRLRNSVSGLINMIGFLVLMNFIASLMVRYTPLLLERRQLIPVQAVQFFRGDVPQQDDEGESIEMTFSQTFNSFLSVFQARRCRNAGVRF